MPLHFGHGSCTIKDYLQVTNHRQKTTKAAVKDTVRPLRCVHTHDVTQRARGGNERDANVSVRNWLRSKFELFFLRSIINCFFFCSWTLKSMIRKDPGVYSSREKHTRILLKTEYVIIISLLISMNKINKSLGTIHTKVPKLVVKCYNMSYTFESN